MSSRTFILAMFDRCDSNKWSILPRKFIIEENNKNYITGVYLSDLWFNKEIGKVDYKNSIHFMLIEPKLSKLYVLDDLNRMISENHHPSSLDIPLDTSKRAQYFCLEKDDINSTSKAMIENDIQHKSISLISDDFKAELSFTISYEKTYDIVTISLPRFKIN